MNGRSDPIMGEMANNGSQNFHEIMWGIVKFNCSQDLKNLSKMVEHPIESFIQILYLTSYPRYK